MRLRADITPEKWKVVMTDIEERLCLPAVDDKALDGLKNFSDGGITKPITYGAGNHDPLHCFQWLHNASGHWKTTSGWNCFG